MDIHPNAVVRVVNNRIEVFPDPILVTRPGVARIVWTLDPAAVAAGFRFDRARGGIRIEHEDVGGKPERAAIGTEFEPPAGRDTQYAVVFRNTRPGRHEYKYSITLLGPNGAELHLDPAIVNDW